MRTVSTRRDLDAPADASSGGAPAGPAEARAVTAPDARAPRRRLPPGERRADLLRAAADAFRAAPYDAVAVSEIARAAGASEALVFKYFGTKAELFALLVELSVAELAEEQRAALEAIAPGAPARDRVRASIRVYLDHIAGQPKAWAAPLRLRPEPAAATGLRRAARERFVAELAALLPPRADARARFALWGYFGFLDGACLRWVDEGCPDDAREPLIEAALGALEGALGDWG